MISLIKISVFLSLALLTACNSFPLYQAIGTSLYDGIIGSKERYLNSEEIEQIKYSFLQAKLGKGDDVILILEKISNDRLYWISSTGEYIITDSERFLAGTIGLPMNVRYHSKKVIFEDGYSFHYFADFINPTLASVKFDAELISKGIAPPNECLPSTGQCYKFEENFVADEINWSGKNTYYVDKNNKLINSIIEFHPFLPSIKLKRYK